MTGTGSSMTGSGLTVTANGSADPITTFYSGAASNNAFGSFPTGGALTLSNSTLLTTGTQTFSVYTANGGTTPLNSDSGMKRFIV